MQENTKLTLLLSRLNGYLAALVVPECSAVKILQNQQALLFKEGKTDQFIHIQRRKLQKIRKLICLHFTVLASATILFEFVN